MALTWKARTAFTMMRGLAVVGLAPSMKRALRMSMAKRLSSGPPKGLVGSPVEVATADRVIQTRDAVELRVRLYQPAGATIPVVYAHGGGFVMGGVASCDHICRRLAVEAGAVVLSVEYRLAPEHPFPGPLEDVEDALDWLLQHADELGVDRTRLVVAGDSAGGNLAAALALRLRERRTPLLGQLLIYPTVDLTLSGDGIRTYAGVGLTSEECRLCAEQYLNGSDPTHPLASPLLAEDLGGLAAALVITVEHDPLRAEGAAYVERLRGAGVRARLLDLLDHAHGSLSLPSLYRGIDELYGEMCAFVREPASVMSTGTPAQGAG